MRNVNGTPGNTVAPSRSICSRARARWSRNGFGLSNSTSVAPLRTAASRQQPIPYVWNSAIVQKMLSSPVRLAAAT
jgi:hypothetical protein